MGKSLAYRPATLVGGAVQEIEEELDGIAVVVDRMILPHHVAVGMAIASDDEVP